MCQHEPASFAPAAPDLAAPDPAVPAPDSVSRIMPPGTYLRLRRQAAGLTIAEAARAAGFHPVGAAWFADELEDLEQGTYPGSAIIAVRTLSGAFPFDYAVWEALAEHAADPASELPVPLICTGCGCSWNDPCMDRDHGPCSWRTDFVTPATARCCYCPPAEGSQS